MLSGIDSRTFELRGFAEPRSGGAKSAEANCYKLVFLINSRILVTKFTKNIPIGINSYILFSFYFENILNKLIIECPTTPIIDVNTEIKKLVTKLSLLKLSVIFVTLLSL
jgi:hypothetical protein